jgi:hypothetical protein
MFNLKKDPKKQHSIGQEFKTLVDHHTLCILRMDAIGNPRPKYYDEHIDMHKLTVTVKRLVKPWLGSGIIVVTDS